MSQKALECLVRKCLDGVPLDFIRRAARKCERYMDAYRKGATGRLAAFANKKYRSHRCLLASPPASWFDDVKNEYYAAFGEVAADSIIDVSAVNATRPALGESDVEEEDGAEEAEAETSEDGEESSDGERSGPETMADREVEAETDESEHESDINESDDAAGEVDDAHNERRTSITKKAIAVLEAPMHRPGCAPKTAWCGGWCQLLQVGASPTI
jgi:hypothetical protein